MDIAIFIAYTPLNKRIRLTKERLTHIIGVHPVMKGLTENIKTALTSPEMIKRSVHDPNVWLYYISYGEVKGRYLIIVVKITNGEGFVVTGYIADRIKTGGNIWPK